MEPKPIKPDGYGQNPALVGSPEWDHPDGPLQAVQAQEDEDIYRHHQALQPRDVELRSVYRYEELSHQQLGCLGPSASQLPWNMPLGREMLDEGNEYRFNVAAAASCSYPSSYLPLDPELALTGPAPLASGDDVAARYMPSMSDVASHTPQQASHCAQCQDSEIFGSATGSGLLSDAGPWTPCSPIPLDLTDGNETGSWAKIRPEASETQDPLRLDVSSLQRVIDPSLLSDTRLERWPDGVKPVNAFGPWVGEQADGLAHQHAEGPPCASQEYPEMSAPLPEMFPDQVDYDAYAADDEEIWGTAMEAEDETVAGQPPTPALDHSGVQCVGQDDQVPDPGGIQPAGRGQFRLGQRPDAKDRFLVQAKRAGMPYREIRARGNFTEAESTLRGRFRALTKAKEYRVRKPEWQPHDLHLLRNGVAQFSRTARSQSAAGNNVSHTAKISWKKVADYIVANGGSYRFGYATCRKMWDKLQNSGH